MIDTYQTKQLMNSLVDTVSNNDSLMQTTQGELSRMRDRLMHLEHGHRMLSDKYHEQVAYFNELVPGFTEAFRARQMLDKHTQPNDGPEAGTTFQR